jgi:hypothetical protein
MHFALAVILNAVKDPEDPHSPQPLETFHSLSLPWIRQTLCGPEEIFQTYTEPTN